MKTNLTELVFILDRSGSMGGLENDTIGGFNSMLAKQQVGIRRVPYHNRPVRQSIRNPARPH